MRYLFAAFVLLYASLASAQVVPPLRLYDHGTVRPLRYKLNILGTGASCVDNPGTATTDCTLAGSGTGTVTSIGIGAGLLSTQTPLTTAGTLSLNTALGVNLLPTDLTYKIGDTSHRLTGVYAQHYTGGGTTPAIATGSGIGNGTCSITGSDAGGLITIAMGSGGSGVNLCNVTFNVAYDHAPAISLTNANSNSQQLRGFFVPADGDTNGVTSSTFSINYGDAPSNGTTYKVFYTAVGRN